MFHTNFVVKLKIFISCSITFLSKIMPFMRLCVKSIVGQVTDENMVHAHCILDS